MTEGQDTNHLICRPSCGECGQPASYIELLPPGVLPSAWAAWRVWKRRAFDEYRDPTMWWILFEGIDGNNGLGNNLSAEEAAPYLAAFTEPLTFKKVHKAGLFDDAGFCEECDRAYCRNHWNVSAGGFGHCPQGHGKSLDPHWWPDDYD